MKEKPNYYAIIPAEIRYDNKLRDKAKLLYGEIVALSNKDGVCYASNKYFAELYNVSITTISLLIKELIENGYIESEFSYKENSKEIDHRYLKIIKEPIKKNLKNNNINNNINNNNINKEEQIFDYYQQEIGTLTPNQYELLLSYIDKLDVELIKEAINISVNNGVKNMSYLIAILKDFINKGYKSIKDIETPLKSDANEELDDELINDLKELDEYMNNIYN